MEIFSVIKKAVVTEKSTISRDEAGKYIFAVHPQANKIEIATAVEKIFKVKVESVRVMNVPAKKKRVGKTVGEKAGWKKAIVTVASGGRIEIYEGV